MTHTYLKNLLLLAVMLLGAGAANAVNKMYIENFALYSTAEKTVDVLYNFENDAVTISGTIVTPEGMEILEVKRNDDVFSEQMTLSFNKNTGKFVIADLTLRPLKVKSGVLFTVSLKASQELLDQNKIVDLVLKDLEYAYMDANRKPTACRMDPCTTKVTVASGEVYTTTSTQNFVINPGYTSEVGIGLYNTTNIEGIQLEILIPEGLTVKPDDKGNLFNMTSRSNNGTTIIQKPLKDTNGYSLVIMNMSGGNVIEGSEGDFLTFELEAPRSFKPETGKITVRKLIVFNGFIKFYPETFEINFVNGDPYYSQANLAIYNAEKALQDVLDHIAANDPDVKDQYTGEDITARINELKEAVKAAYLNKTLPFTYDEVMAPLQGILDDIAKLKTDADAAQEEFTKEKQNKDKYDELTALVASLREKLTQALATIEETCPNVKNDYKGDEISNQIDAMENAIETAYANKTCATDFDNLKAPAEGIEADITKLVSDAQAAEADYVARKALFDEDMSTVSDLETELDNALQQIESECPDVKDDFQGADITAAINNLKNAIQDAFDNKTIVENNDEIMSVVPDIRAMIAKLISDAKNAQANQTVYKQAIALYDDLMDQFNAAQEEIASTCPDVKNKFKGEDILESIHAYRESILAALADGTIQSNYNTLTSVVPGIEEDIEQLVIDAKAEQARFTSNLAAYNADISLIDSLQSSLDQAVADIRVKYPDFDVDAAKAPIQEAIDAEREQAEEAYDAVEDEGTYSNTVDADAIRNMIAQMKVDAESSGITSITAEDMANIKAVYNLNGVKLNAPQMGKVNIVIMKDGTNRKIFFSEPE